MTSPTFVSAFDYFVSFSCSSRVILTYSSITELCDLPSGSSEVAIDIECGAFGDNGCIDWVKTDIDRQLDEDSLFTNSFSLVSLESWICVHYSQVYPF